jgi:hypothetical protein
MNSFSDARHVRGLKNVRDRRVHDYPPVDRRTKSGAAGPADRVGRHLAGPVIAVAPNVARADLIGVVQPART